MASLAEEWRSICRFLGGDTAAPADDGAGSATAPESAAPDNGARHGKLLRWLRSLGRRLGSGLRRPRPPSRAGQSSGVPLWLEVTREEPRANRRALGLLLKLLNAEQREEFKKAGHFYVIGGKSHARYRIRPDRVANIDVMGEDGTVMYRLCVAPAGGVPVYDVMAAQMLHLQDAGAEERFVQMANVFYRMGSRPAWF